MQPSLSFLLKLLITISLLFLYFLCEEQSQGAERGRGALNQTLLFYLCLHLLLLKKCKSVLMFWIPLASVNCASMFELIKNFLSSITTLNAE